jgi:hypothetical protein
MLLAEGGWPQAFVGRALGKWFHNVPSVTLPFGASRRIRQCPGVSSRVISLKPFARKSGLLLDNQAPSRRRDHVIHSDARTVMLLAAEIVGRLPAF